MGTLLWLVVVAMACWVAGIPLNQDVKYSLPYQYPPISNPTTLDNSVLSIMKKYEVAGLGLATITSNGEFQWVGAYGWLNISEKTSFAVNSLIREASISKQVSAISILQQYELGRCDLDTDISNYIGFTLRNPSFPDVPITLRQLLDHTSSIMGDDYDTFANACDSAIGPTLSIQDLLLPGGAYYNPTTLWNTEYPPGDQAGYHYSNVNPMVVATAVEWLSGERFDLYTKAHVFDVLLMNTTSFNLQSFDKATSKQLSPLYNYFYPKSDYYIASAGMDDQATYASRVVNPIDYSVYVIGTNGGLFAPQGGMRSCLRDLIQLKLAHLNGGALPSDSSRRILSKESIDLMHTVQSEFDAVTKYGLYQEITNGFTITEQTMTGHTGDKSGFHGIFYFQLDSLWGLIEEISGATLQYTGDFLSVEVELFNLLYDTFVL
ncbi:serine hydrolase [Pelomyxa schiedti]|nr:serine hydrolase [Pelomyxa schiedti]